MGCLVKVDVAQLKDRCQNIPDLRDTPLLKSNLEEGFVDLVVVLRIVNVSRVVAMTLLQQLILLSCSNVMPPRCCQGVESVKVSLIERN